MYCCLGNYVGVEPVAKVDGVDIVTEIQTYRISIYLMQGAVIKPPQCLDTRCVVWWAMPDERLPFQIAVHDGEEDLQEQIDRVYKHGE